MKQFLAGLGDEQISLIKEEGKIARSRILTMTTLAKSGHPGGSMSVLDVLLTVYKTADVNPRNPQEEGRDRIIISNGHVSPAVYSCLAANGFFDADEMVSQFRLAGSIYEGHVEPDVPGVEWATGNLGQGLSAAAGFALADREKGYKNNVFVIMGDGEQQKGQIGEARRFCKKFGLNNITVFVDYNRLQIGGSIEKVMPQNIAENYKADGWSVIEINGHDIAEISSAIAKASQIDSPVMILAHTVMGKGVSFMENKAGFHGAPLSEEQLADALKELDMPDRLAEFKKMRAEVGKLELPEHKSNFNLKFETGRPKVYESKTDNRSGWGNAIADLAEINKDKNTNIIVFDCDLQGSVKLNAFEKVLPNRFFQSGIMEHNTAVVAGAVSKAGFQTFWADFGVFGVNEAINQHRLSDINKANLKVVTTHVGLDVGEDGKTHQCIDYIGMMKNLYHFRVIVPADANQTDRAVRFLINQPGNYLLAMGRSKLGIIKNSAGDIYYDENYVFEYGKADKLREGKDGALLVTGTLTERATEVVDKLAEKGIKLQLWNVASPNDTDEEMIKEAVATGKIFTYEDHTIHTGLGNSVAQKMADMKLCAEFERFGVEDYAMSGNSADVYRLCRLDTDSVVERISEKY